MHVPSVGWFADSLTTGPRAGANIERRVGDSTWLGLYADGSFQSLERDEGPEYTRESVAMGVRLRQVAARSGPVRVSANAGLSGNYSRLSDDEGLVVERERILGLFGVGGVALELPLTDGLELRLASDIAHAGWVKVRRKMASGMSGDLPSRLSGWVGWVGFDPSLELRAVW